MRTINEEIKRRDRLIVLVLVVVVGLGLPVGRAIEDEGATTTTRTIGAKRLLAHGIVVAMRFLNPSLNLLEHLPLT